MSYARAGSRALIRGGALGLALLVVLLAASTLAAQERRGPRRLQDGAANSQEVRPASPDGDSPSATAGKLLRQPESRRLLGLPVEAVMWIGGILVVLVLIAAVIAGRPGRGAQAQGGGTYGRGPGK